jgi:hypothetical protein
MPTTRAFLALALAVGMAVSCGDGGQGSAQPTPPGETAVPGQTPGEEGPAEESPEPTGPPEFTATVAKVSRDQLRYSWREGCPVPVSGLRMVTMTFWGFDDRAHTGRLVVNRDVADDVTEIFGQLYEWRFPIERMQPVDAYRASDFDSIEANNTSAFNCRRTTGATSWSKHSYGRAIDLNPRQNPWVEPDGSYAHKNAKGYTTRPLDKPGVINPGDRVVKLFAKHGWQWGGYFSGAKDYQHFAKGGG